MNQYVEAIAVGALAAAITFVSGIGAGARAQAGQGIELVPRISGRIQAINFVPEQQVKKGEVLLVIESGPYEAAYDKAQAELGKAQWRYEFAIRDHSRAVYRSASHNAGGEDLARSTAAVEQASATVQADKLALAAAQADLDNTRVIAPRSGIVGLPEVTVGGLVESGRTRLTTLRPGESQ